MIRTYSRKPQACHFIEGAAGLCRLCLAPAAGGAPIFADGPVSPLALRVMICVGLEIKKEDCLPNLICNACCKELEQYYAFRKKCEVSYQKLKSHLQAARIRQATETITQDNMGAKDIEINQDENMNINEIGLIMEENEGNCSKVIEVQDAPTPTISDVRSETCKVETEHSTEVTEPLLQKATHTMDPEQLSSMISSILMKIGVLVEHEGQLSCLRDVAQIQLETGDGGLVQMELVEEEELQETRTTQITVDESESLLAPAPVAPEADSKNTVTVTKKHPRVNVRAPSVTPPRPARGGAAAGGAWRCAECGRALASRSALRRHARTHSGERPFPCPDCARRFAQKEVMVRHRLVHKEVRPHQCAKCPKSFTQRSALVVHARSHLPPAERPLALRRCPRCPKLFLHASGLSRHLASHDNRVFECGACQRQFADRSAVLRHVRRARHGEKGGDDAEGGAGDRGEGADIKEEATSKATNNKSIVLSKSI